MHSRQQPLLPIALMLGALLVAGCASTPVEAPAADAGKTASAAAAAGATAAQRSASAPAAATAPGAAPATTPAAAAAGAAAAAAAAAAAQGRPFAEVVKDAKETKGFFTLWQKDDKVWLEIAPEQFDQPFFLSSNLSQGLGENWLFAGMMAYPGLFGVAQIAYLHKIGNNVQLIVRNDRFFARPNTGEALAVADGFSNSLAATAPLAAQSHPERKSQLVELNTLLLNDIPGANGFLELTYRQPYSFDARNSSITRTRNAPDQTSINVSAHYALGRVIQPPTTPGAPYTQPPSTVPDIRSLFLGFYYNFSRLPAEPMRPRMADARVGYFNTVRYDFSQDYALTPRQTYVRRWRLEKKDAAAALSEPQQPIVFWLDRTIPERYRSTVISGVLEWNKAFERIGFKDALQARLLPDDADFDTLDARHASIRWMVSARPMFGGIGLTHVDPRTGEILDAEVGIDPVRIRNRRATQREQVANPLPIMLPNQTYACLRGEYAAEEMAFALDLLEARGDIAAGSEQEEELILASLKETVMHEIGHVLGLTHNFRASTVYTRAQLSDPEFTRANGIAGSVMEYTPVNLALAGERQGAYEMTTLGPYDYWAIEYGYQEIPAAEEAAELRKVAARNTEALLAYAYDEESNIGVDPDANMLDLSNDPLDFAQRRLKLARELWDRWQVRDIPAGDSLAIYRRNITRGLSSVREAGLAAARYVGGVSLLRDAAGSGRTPINPVAPAKQRAALLLIETGVFGADSFNFRPDFLRRLSVDWLDRFDSFEVGLTTPGFDYSLPNQVLAVQRTVLDRVLSDAAAQRVLDSEAKVDNPKEAVKLSEIYGSLHRAIWSELKTGQDITLLRRNLQREHATRLATSLLRPAATMPADARAVARADAKALRAEIAAAQARSTYSAEAKAHLAETLQTLDEALRAPIVRSTV
jgi:hypothetical protein